METTGQRCPALGASRSAVNPFDSDLARAHSAYGKFDGDALVRADDPSRPLSPLQVQVHAEFRARMLAPEFSCVGAKAAFNGGAYRLGLYPDLTGGGSLAGLARDLWTFTREQPALGSDFTTFVAAFEGPRGMGEADFEAGLWGALQSLYDVDRLFSPADPRVNTDPGAGDFGFSFGGRGFFIIGLHPESPRLARQFPWPALVFNAHFQFDKLKADGRYPKMQTAIRGRELSWQGSLNPNLADFGEQSEARQYSGRAVEDDWQCPFHLHNQDKPSG